MLTHIHIWNFAIVEQLDLELEPGLTVLTGETGAGKSIMLDALGLALGDRAESSVIRHGAEKAEISVTFSTTDTPDAEDWLKEQELDSENECIIRRVITPKGSKAFINGKPAPVQMLKELGEMLLDLHGQHEHQSLLRKEAQRQLLDDYAAHNPLVNHVRTAYKHYRNLEKELHELRSATSDRQAKLDLLRYQVNELDTLSLQENEVEELEQEHKRLANANQLLESCERIQHALNENDYGSVESVLNQGVTDLTRLLEHDSTLSNVSELLNNALIQVQEASSELRHYISDLELDPDRLNQLEERLSDITDLSRKHHCDSHELHTVLPKLQEQLEQLEAADLRNDNLESELNAAREEYLKLARQLSASRAKAANQLSEKVSTSMHTLGMEGGQFKVALTIDESELSEFGLEKVEFLVSANPGQPIKPLTKVASGGELSRISLAIQVITAQNSRIATLIFDEVDVGIGGRVAEIVGRLLRELSQHHQVICVTHLAQVAALGHHHLQVSKQAESDMTISQILELNPKQRVDEVARMIGGIEITEQTLLHAQEMLDKASA